jgi:hypothetical protein
LALFGDVRAGAHSQDVGMLQELRHLFVVQAREQLDVAKGRGRQVLGQFDFLG